jgi:hypothetical protein
VRARGLSARHHATVVQFLPGTRWLSRGLRVACKWLLRPLLQLTAATADYISKLVLTVCLRFSRSDAGGRLDELAVLQRECNFDACNFDACSCLAAGRLLVLSACMLLFPRSLLPKFA